MQELQEKYDIEEEKLQKIRTDMIELEKNISNLEEKWNEMVSELLPIIADCLSLSRLHIFHYNYNWPLLISISMYFSKLDTQESYEDKDLGENLVQRIASLLLQGEYRSAVMLVKHADFAAGNRDER